MNNLSFERSRRDRKDATYINICIILKYFLKVNFYLNPIIVMRVLYCVSKFVKTGLNAHLAQPCQILVTSLASINYLNCLAFSSLII